MTSNKIQKIKLVSMALSLIFGFILLSTVSVQAQNNDRWGNNRNNRWGNTNKRAVGNLIRRVEQRTDVFVRQVDRGLDNSRVDGTRREDRINQLARRLENATNELRREFDRGDSLQENRDEVQRIISLASEIDQAIRRGRRIGNGVQNSWNNLKGDLNTLARTYNVRRV